MKLLRKVLDKTYSDLKNVNKVVLVSVFYIVSKKLKNKLQ
jgi:hypothetical protein